MKYLKVQQDLLKMTDARDGWKHRPFNVPWFEADDKIWVIFDGVIGYGIPKIAFYLDKDKVFGDAVPLNSGEQFIKNATYADEAEDTHTILDVVIDNKKMKLHRFMVKDEAVYVKEEFLKNFELECSHFTGTKRTAPLYVFEDDNLVGIIFPVNYKG